MDICDIKKLPEPEMVPGTHFEEAEAEICRKGMHFCLRPLDVLHCYPAVTLTPGAIPNVYARVDALAPITSDSEGCKSVTTKLRIHERLEIAEFVKVVAGYYDELAGKPYDDASDIQWTSCNDVYGRTYTTDLRFNKQKLVLPAPMYYSTIVGRIMSQDMHVRVTGSASLLISRYPGVSVQLLSEHNELLIKGYGSYVYVAGSNNHIVASADYTHVFLSLTSNVVLVTGDSGSVYDDKGYNAIVIAGIDNQVLLRGGTSTVRMLASGYAYIAGHRNQALLEDGNSYVVLAGNSNIAETHGNFCALSDAGNNNSITTSGECCKIAVCGVGSAVHASGRSSALASSGNRVQLHSSGADSVCAGIGRNNIVKGALGSWLVLAEWKDGVPVCVKAVQVDGKEIKADKYYKLRAGRIVKTKALYRES